MEGFKFSILNKQLSKMIGKAKNSKAIGNLLPFIMKHHQKR